MAQSLPLQQDLRLTHTENDDHGRDENGEFRRGDQHNAEQPPPEQPKEQHIRNAETDRSWREQEYDYDVGFHINHQARKIDGDPLKERRDGNAESVVELHEIVKEIKHIQRNSISERKLQEQKEPNDTNVSVQRRDYSGWQNQGIREPEGNQKPQKEPENERTRHIQRNTQRDRETHLQQQRRNSDINKKARYNSGRPRRNTLFLNRQSQKESDKERYGNTERKRQPEMELQQKIEPIDTNDSVQRLEHKGWHKHGIRKPLGTRQPQNENETKKNRHIERNPQQDRESHLHKPLGNRQPHKQPEKERNSEIEQNSKRDRESHLQKPLGNRQPHTEPEKKRKSEIQQNSKRDRESYFQKQKPHGNRQPHNESEKERNQHIELNPQRDRESHLQQQRRDSKSNVQPRYNFGRPRENTHEFQGRKPDTNASVKRRAHIGCQKGGIRKPLGNRQPHNKPEKERNSEIEQNSQRVSESQQHLQHSDSNTNKQPRDNSGRKSSGNRKLEGNRQPQKEPDNERTSHSERNPQRDRETPPQQQRRDSDMNKKPRYNSGRSRRNTLFVNRQSQKEADKEKYDNIERKRERKVELQQEIEPSDTNPSVHRLEHKGRQKQSFREPLGYRHPQKDSEKQRNSHIERNPQRDRQSLLQLQRHESNINVQPRNNSGKPGNDNRQLQGNRQSQKEPDNERYSNIDGKRQRKRVVQFQEESDDTNAGEQQRDNNGLQRKGIREAQGHRQSLTEHEKERNTHIERNPRRDRESQLQLQRCASNINGHPLDISGRQRSDNRQTLKEVERERYSHYELIPRRVRESQLQLQRPDSNTNGQPSDNSGRQRMDNRQPQKEVVKDRKEEDNEEKVQRRINGNVQRIGQPGNGPTREKCNGVGVGAGRGRGLRTGKGFRGRMAARNIHELQNLEPSAIALTLANSHTGFKDALDTCPIPLLLDVIAKAFTCHSTNETLNTVYIAIKEQGFFNSLVGYFMTMINDISEEKTKEFKKPIADMITIMEEIIVKNPTCIPEFVGIHTMLQMVIDALSVKSNIIDDDLVERFREFTELRDKRLKHSVRANVGNKYDARDKELDAKGPPNDFREIQVLPQTSDMQLTDDHYLRANKVKGKYNDLDHYLDVQFRLLREDFIAPLRDGIVEFVRSLTERGNAKKGHQDIRIYKNVRIIAPYCSDSGICYALQIDVSRLQLEWKSSKRLIFGTLLCLSPDAFNTLYFATVVNRDDKMINHGIIQVRFETDHATVKTLIGNTFMMAETSAYFESYRHNLLGLQNIRDGDLPFENYITDCENDVRPPAYVRRNHDVNIDLRPLVDEKYVIVDDTSLKSMGETIVSRTKRPFSEKSKPAKDVSLLNRDTWPPHDLLHLDESQYEAIHTALTREFVITQGPPGTGKTYIGLNIVKALLHNRNLWNKNPVTGETDNRPMLIVCYTNHALDQFLEGIKKFYQGDILRVGSGSKSDILQSDNLKYYRREFRHKKAFPDHINQARQDSRNEMNSLTEEINETCLKIQIASTHIIHEDYLQRYIGQRHYMLFNSQFRSILIGAGIFIPWKTSIIVEWLELGSSAPLVRRIGEQEVNDAVNKKRPRQSYGDVFDLRNTIDDMHLELQYQYKTKTEDVKAEADSKKISSAEKKLLKAKALDVESIGEMPDDKSKAGWEMQRNARKRLKRNTQKNLASTEMMTEEEANVITELWRLSMPNKWRLYRFWIKQYTDHLWKQVERKENEYEVVATRYKEAVIQEDKEIMRLSTVIGMTTTCAARYQPVLQEINPRIIVVEEAAEVLEAHIVTTLTKGCEHLILIGDHKQLKPNPTVYTLAKDYNLDVSLFERMISNGVRCDCLTLQHRMRPEIVELIKHIYPRLENHIDVQKYESMKGVACNMFFINHTNHESDAGDLRSHSNIHEASYIVSLCRYLMLQGYDPNKITVLTTYSGQLLCLKKMMPPDDFEGVQITVVDNYQGEENDIILLSLVRSNKEGSIGFLKVSNRVCVALSRAKKAFYVIGNCNLLADKSELWKKIKLDIEKKGHIGDGLALYCQNHPDMNGIIARQASDFSQAPEGGCNKKCEYRLNCGHVCGMYCHILDKEHVRYKCMEDCHNILCENEHRCPKKCYEECGKCNVPIEKIIPECGHKQYISCHQDPSTFDCPEPCIKLLTCTHQCASRCGLACTTDCLNYVKKKWPCGHVGEVRCFEAATIVCPKPCDSELTCKHMCLGTCGTCFEGRLHITCKNACNRILLCGHECKDMCSMCPPCTEMCNNMCNHSKCSKSCGEICVQCKMPCEWICKHYKCSRLCSEPCDRPRCNEPCEKCLPCGHACIGLCGEPCPSECRQCDKDKVAMILFGEEDVENARFVVLQDCGNRCIIEYKAMDKFMDTTDVEGEIKLKSCPKCNTTIRRNVRYGSMIKKTLQELEEVKYKIITNRKRLILLEDNIKLDSVSLQDATSKCIMARLEDMPEPKSENTLVALNNQITIFKTIEALQKKWMKVSEKRKGLENLKKLHIWTIELRSCMSQQEIEDAQLELSRSNDHLKIQYFQLLFRNERKMLRRELNANIKHAKCILTKRGRYTELHQNVVRTCITELKKESSSTDVTDEEIIQIVTATAFRKSHWFKCKNGHVYTIGDCDGPTEESKCLECKCSYALGDNNNVARHMDGARFAAWSEQRKLANYVYTIQL